MNFEVKNALLDLDQKTPEYFLRELWAHGKLEVKQSAQESLKDLDNYDDILKALKDYKKVSRQKFDKRFTTRINS